MVEVLSGFRSIIDNGLLFLLPLGTFDLQKGNFILDKGLVE
jgi:hypothetical protein